MAARTPSWWATRGLQAILLLPLSLIFHVVATLRRALYRGRWLGSVRMPVPVVVVGNIAVGGSGKTPVVAWLVEALRAAGFAPGIVSRGHGGRVSGAAIVPPTGDPLIYGDEPVLLARDTGCPVAVGADRVAAVRELLAHHDCNVIVADDGLQHYRLERDIEIIVVDERVLGNRWPLPAGPLREGLGRLREADLVIAHGELSTALRVFLRERPVFGMRLHGDHCVRMDDGQSRPLSDFAGRPVHAVAGIGRPERFFEQLRAAGLEVIGHPFPDHHVFVPKDLDFSPGEVKILTAKDAVKCAAFAPAETWMFPVRAGIDAAASQRIVEKLTHGSSIA